MESLVNPRPLACVSMASTVPEESAAPLAWRSALVTGASSGIGAEIARRLAQRGVGELVLVARRTERLAKIASELSSAHGTEVETLTADLGADEGRTRVEQRLAETDRPVDLLVNNAGLGTGGRFTDVDIDAFDHQVQVNVVAAMRLMHAALGPMASRGSGAVMNISSVAAWQALPGSSVYSAGKAFVLQLGEAVHGELRGTGVTVTGVCPGFTRTEFHDAMTGEEDTRAIPGFAWMQAGAVVDAAIDATAAGKAVCVPGLGYRVLATISDVAPRGPRRWVVAKLAGTVGQ